MVANRIILKYALVLVYSFSSFPINLFLFSDEGTDITKVLDSLIQDIGTKKQLNGFRQAQQVAIIISDGKSLQLFNVSIHIFI